MDTLEARLEKKVLYGSTISVRESKTQVLCTFRGPCVLTAKDDTRGTYDTVHEKENTV